MSEIDTSETIGLRLTRELPATPEEVFDAYTDAEKQKIWFSILDEEPGVVEIEVDLRVGGKQVAVWGPNRDTLFREEQVFIEIDRPHRLVTESSGSDPSGQTMSTHVVVTFEAIERARSSPSSRPASRPPRSATSSRRWSGSARSTASRPTSRAPDRVRGESIRLAAARVRGRQACSTSEWFTLDTGTRSMRSPFGLLSVLDVRQHQSNALDGRFVTNGPAHCMPASFSAYQKYLAPFDAPPRMVARPPGPICHHPFFAQLSPSQFGEW